MVSGYTDPGNVDDGDTIDPAWGDNVRANLNLQNGIFDLCHPVQVNNTTITISNSTTETAILTYTVPGGTLGTNNALSFRLHCRGYNNALGDKAINLTLKYGSTELVTGVGSFDGAGARNLPFYVDGILKNNGAANTQYGALYVPYSALMEAPYAGFGTAAEDSTGDLDLVVTMQFGTASADLQFYMTTSVLHLLKE